MEKLSELLQSVRFWTLIVSLTGIWTAVYIGSLSVVDAINASVAALAAFSLGRSLTAAKG